MAKKLRLRLYRTSVKEDVNVNEGLCAISLLIEDYFSIILALFMAYR